ncbi:MAG: DNA-binding domain-containing protein [Victivallaceae bacterium]|nr:DNA-binding domain-containing protein [Victivallaceae bacterium]
MLFGDLVKKSLLPVVKKPGSSAVARASAPEVPAAAEAAPSEYRQLAAERWRFLQLVRQAKIQYGKNDQSAVEFVALNHALEFPLLTTAGKGGSSALNYPNYRQWRSRAKAHPGKELEALTDRYASGVRDKSGDARFWRYAQAFYLNRNRLPITKCYKMAAEKLRREDPAAIIPSYAQLRWRIDQLDKKMVVLAREGEVALKNKFGSFVERSWGEVYPGECVVCDSRTFDTRIRVWDEAGQRWVARRPTIAGMMDARSWYMAAYWITDSAISSENLIDTLGLYLHNTGNVPPAIAYCDNGSDYCKAGFSKPLEGQSIFKELGIQLINAIPYNARAKTIERCFRDMMQEFDKSFADYLGSKPSDRSQAANWFERHPEQLPSLQEFCAAFADWLDTYHRTPRRGKILDGHTPLDVWQSRPARPAVPAERLPFAFLLPVAVRQVKRGPAVELNKIGYFNDDLFPRIGEKVLLKVDRLDRDRLVVFDLAGRLICEARTRRAIKALALDDPAAREAIAAEMARQRREVKQVYTMIDAATGGLHLVSPSELFRAAAGDALAKVGSVVSVKGASHRYDHHVLGAPAPEPEPPAKTAAPALPAADADVDISGFHNFVTNNYRRDQDDDY